MKIKKSIFSTIFFSVAKLPVSKWMSVIIDEKTGGGCIEKKPFRGGSKKLYFVSEQEMVDIGTMRSVVEQRLRKFSLYSSFYLDGRISKDRLLARCRRNRTMIKVGDYQGAQPHIYLKRKDSREKHEDESEDEDEIEGLFKTSHFVSVKIQLVKTDVFGGTTYPNGTDTVTLSLSEFGKVIGHFDKHLSKKGVEYQTVVPDDQEIISDYDEDDEEDEIFIPSPKGGKRSASIAAVNKETRSKAARGGGGGAGKKGGKGKKSPTAAAKKGRVSPSNEEDYEEEEEEDESNGGQRKIKK